MAVRGVRFPGCPAVGHAHRLSDLDGRTVVITGGAAGIGYFAAEGLAALGAHVIIAGRSRERATAARRAIQAHVRGAKVSFQQLDLADLSSVAAAARQLAALPALDLLVANAGAIGYPDHIKLQGERGARTQVTTGGHELYWGTNFLGHYALVGLLMPLLLASAARCVFVGSLGDRLAPLPVDLAPSPGWAASDLAKYAQSKLATTTLMHELARRGTAHTLTVVGAHPGAATDFLSPPRTGVALNQPTGSPLMRTPTRLFTHGKHKAALPILTASACPHTTNGDYWGPRWITKGRPTLTRAHPASKDAHTARRLLHTAATLSAVQLPL